MRRKDDGLTYEEAKQLGVEKLHPDHERGGKLFGGRPKQAKSPDGMNKLERSFFEHVKWQARDRNPTFIWREPITFRLAGNTRYTPDFLVISGATQSIYNCVDTKGHMEDDASVKIKVAAEMFPCFRFLLVVRAGRNGWEVREVTRTGIGRTPIRVPWI
jgi:hypothetical protein